MNHFNLLTCSNLKKVLKVSVENQEFIDKQPVIDKFDTQIVIDNAFGALFPEEKVEKVQLKDYGG
jgi:hypothetical protein